MFSKLGKKGSAEQPTTATRANTCGRCFIESSRRRYFVLSSAMLPTNWNGVPNVIIALQNVLPEVLVLDDPQQPLPHRRPVEHDVFGRIVWQLEHHVLEQRRHHGVQPPGADVLHALVHLCRDARDFLRSEEHTSELQS